MKHIAPRIVVTLLCAVGLGVAGCRTVGVDPATMGDRPACAEDFRVAQNAWGWKRAVAGAGTIAGGALGIAGPVVFVAGIALDPEPATPPVEAFVVGAALASAGVATVIISGAVGASAADDSTAAQRAYAEPCPG